jgi:hypothetical protein
VEGACRINADLNEDKRKFAYICTMKSQMIIHFLLVFLAVAVCSFDKHLAFYFPGHSVQMVTPNTIPLHSDLPVKSFDYHEDIALKSIFCDIPTPVEQWIPEYRIVSIFITCISPHTVWQPPESTT